MIAFLKRNLLFSRGWFQVPMLKPLRGSCFQLKESEVLPAMRAWSMMIQFSLLVAMLPYASTTGKRTGCVGFLVVPLGLFFFGFSWCSCLSKDIWHLFCLNRSILEIFETLVLFFFTWSVTTISGFAYLWFMNLLRWSFIQWRDTDRLEDFGGNFHPKRYAFKKSFVTSILTLGARVGEGCEAVLCTWHDLAMLRPLAQSTLQQWSGTARTHGEWFIWIRLDFLWIDLDFPPEFRRSDCFPTTSPSLPWFMDVEVPISRQDAWQEANWTQARDFAMINVRSNVIGLTQTSL